LYTVGDSVVDICAYVSHRCLRCCCFVCCCVVVVVVVGGWGCHVDVSVGVLVVDVAVVVVVTVDYYFCC